MIAIIGLGYVGLPLAVAFAKHYKVFGFDINSERISQLNNKIDVTNEIDFADQKIKNLVFTNDLEELKKCNIYIITVPTPIDQDNQPDLTYLINATESIARILKRDDLVIYESTVYPGCTDEICIPILEKNSHLKINDDFYCGYSPERINPGDKINTISKIIKVTSGSSKFAASLVDDLYSKIIDAGTHKASSIKVAEASKAIENAQRDINISFINEVATIFDSLEINTYEVLEAASTKWNFLNFKPGLVGGHCISIDPYYLIYRSIKSGYIPQVIKSGREVNENMPGLIYKKVKKIILNHDLPESSSVLILGYSFKENCSDFRNTKVAKVSNYLGKHFLVDIHDPLIDLEEAKKNKSCNFELRNEKYDIILLLVPHLLFNINYVMNFAHDKSIVFDFKNVLPKSNNIPIYTL